MKRAGLFTFLILVLAYIVYESLTPGKYDDFAECLSKKGVIMYGTDWCPHCQNQKATFGKSFKKITYVNCDIEREKCESAGIRGYPTWVFDKKRLEGEQSLQTLSQFSGCALQQ